MPDVVGLDESDALDALEASGLNGVRTGVPVDSQEQAGSVVTQTPDPSTSVEEGSDVAVDVGRFSWSEPITVEGNGDDVIVDFMIPDDEVAIVTATAQGDSNFVVETYDQNGERLDLLFNAIAPYEGTSLVNLFVDENTRELEVMADGQWTLVFAPISEAPKMSDGIAEGESDSVLVVPQGESPGRVANVTHSGDGNFVVETYGDSGRDLLANEIGDTDVRARWASDTFLVQIMAEGSWRIEVTDG